MSPEHRRAPASPASAADRVVGALLLLAGLAVALEASTFEVAFLTDPVGPKALPLACAGLLAACGGILLRRRPVPRAWPTRRAQLRMAGATAAFLLYALTLSPLGFTLATTLSLGLLSRLFGAPWRKGLAAAFLLSVTLWYLFVWVLGLPLPLGALWTR